MPNDHDDWHKQRKIATLPGVRTDAVTVLARTLEKAQAGKVASVFISIEWNDTTVEADWSNMKIMTLCYHQQCLQHAVQRELFPDE